MTERPSPLERLSTALNSSDLTVDADHRGDVDYVLALGFASAHHSAVAAPMMHVHLTGTHSALHTAYDAVLAMVKRLSAKRNWRLNAQGLQAVALQSLSHHVSPSCEACHGRKFELQDNAPVLSTRVCRSCRGTGRRPVQKKYRDEINFVIAALERIDSVTERAIARLVR